MTPPSPLTCVGPGLMRLAGWPSPTSEPPAAAPIRPVLPRHGWPAGSAGRLVVYEYGRVGLRVRACQSGARSRRVFGGSRSRGGIGHLATTSWGHR